MKLSEYISGYRKHRKLSLRSFADQCGVSYQYINKLEKDQIEKPSLLFLSKIAKGMGMTTEELFTVVDDFTIDFMSNSPTATGRNEVVNRIIEKMNKCSADELALVEMYVDTILRMYH